MSNKNPFKPLDGQTPREVAEYTLWKVLEDYGIWGTIEDGYLRSEQILDDFPDLKADLKRLEDANVLAGKVVEKLEKIAEDLGIEGAW